MEKLIYENPLRSEADVKEFKLEGSAHVSFPEGALRLENARSAEEGQKANYVYWLNRDFPSDVRIEWEVKPLREPGLAIMFFAAKARDGGDIFAKHLAERTGEYPQYHHGDINAFHVSYFRRKEPDERAFHTCNLRKSYGFYLVTQGADPIPGALECRDFYKLCIVKDHGYISFSVNGLKVFEFTDNNPEYGDPLGGGKIGFRQLAPMIGEYRNLKVYEL